MIIHEGKELHTYHVAGQPIAWARPRMSGRTFFDSQKPIKNNWSISLQYQRENQPFYTKTPLEIIIHFYFSIPMTYKPTHKQAITNKPFTYKPDIDNAIKFVLDTCNAILFDDDCCIFKITATKMYDVNPRTEFALIPHPTPHKTETPKKKKPEPIRGYLHV